MGSRRSARPAQYFSLITISMSNNTNSSSVGVGFTGLLFIVFLVLKLTGTIGWSWWWVTAPLWGGLAIFAVIFGVSAITGLLIYAFRH